MNRRIGLLLLLPSLSQVEGLRARVKLETLLCPLGSQMLGCINVKSRSSLNTVKRVLILKHGDTSLVAQFYRRQYTPEEADLILEAFLPHAEHHGTLFDLRFIRMQPALLQRLLSEELRDRWNREGSDIWWASFYTNITRLSRPQVEALLAPLATRPNLLGSRRTGAYAARMDLGRCWALSPDPIFTTTGPWPMPSPEELLVELHNLSVSLPRYEGLYDCYVGTLHWHLSHSPGDALLVALCNLITHSEGWIESFASAVDGVHKLLRRVVEAPADMEEEQFWPPIEALWHAKLLVMVEEGRRLAMRRSPPDRPEGAAAATADCFKTLLVEYIQRYPVAATSRVGWKRLERVAVRHKIQLGAAEILQWGLQDRLQDIEALLPTRPLFWGTLPERLGRWRRFLAQRYETVIRWPRHLGSAEEVAEFWGEYQPHQIVHLLPSAAALQHPVQVVGTECDNLRDLLCESLAQLLHQGQQDGPRRNAVTALTAAGGAERDSVVLRALWRLFITNILHFGHSGLALSRELAIGLLQPRAGEIGGMSTFRPMLQLAHLTDFVPDEQLPLLVTRQGPKFDALLQVLIMLLAFVALLRTTRWNDA